MNTQDLQTMIDYHYWARDRLLEALEPLTAEQYNRISAAASNRSATPRRILRRRVGVVSALARRVAHGAPPSERFADLAALRDAWTVHEQKMRAFVDGLSDTGIARVIPFRLLNGTSGAAPIWQMVQHVVNHASYHRGQITTMLRQLGAAPPKSLDMLAYFR